MKDSSYYKITTEYKLEKSWHVIILGLALTTISILQMILVGDGREWDVLVFSQGQDLFMDFFNHIQYCSKHSKVYFVDHNACFPPFAYMFYYAANRLLPEGTITTFQANATEPYGYLLYVLYCVVVVILISRLISLILDKKYSTLFITLLEIQIVLSYCFAFAIERGNSAIVVVFLLLLFIILRESDKPWQREFAMIILAMAAGIKVYPAIFGLLYVAEKKFKETIRLVVYGIAFFFIPFTWFGGSKGIIQFFKNQAIIQNESSSILSLRGYINSFLNAMLPQNAYNNTLTLLIGIVLLLLVLACFFITNSFYIRCLMLTSIMVLFPLWSGEYTMVYYILPMILFLNREINLDNRIINIIENISFIMIFSTITFLPAFVISKPVYISIIGCYLISLMGVIETIFEIKEEKLKNVNC